MAFVVVLKLANTGPSGKEAHGPIASGHQKIVEHI